MDLFTEVQQILQMLLDTAVIGGGLAVGVLAGYALFKLATLASFLYFAKHVVDRIYTFAKAKLDRPEPPMVTEIKLDGHFITHDATPQTFLLLIEEIRNMSTGNLGMNSYVHRSDVQKAIEIIKEWKRNNPS